MSVLLSTDMFTLIDEDAIVPFDGFIKTPDDQAWLKGFYPAFMENSQTGGKTWGIPFQRSTIVLYYNKELFKEAGLDPNKPPANWEEMTEYAPEADQARRVGQGHAMGRADSLVGISLLAVPGADDRERRDPDERRRATETYYDKPEVIEALQYWVDLVEQVQGASADGIVEWGTTPKDFFERKVAMMWTTTGNLTNVKNNAKFDFGVAMLPAQQAARQPDRRRQFLYLQEGERRRSRRRRSSSSSGSPRRRAPRSGASTPATSRCGRTPGRRRR